MKTVPPNPFSKFTSHAKNAFARAEELAKKERSANIEPRHLLEAILREKGSLARNILALNGVGARIMPATGTKLTTSQVVNHPMPDNAVKNILKKAAATAAFYGHSHIGTEHLLFGVIAHTDLLKKEKKYQNIAVQTEQILLSSAQFQEAKKIIQNPSLLGEFFGKKPQRKTAHSKMGEFPALEFFCSDLVKRSIEGKFLPIHGREKEIGRLIGTLLRKSKNNPLLLGEAGVGKTAVVEGLAQKIASREIAPSLQNKKVFALDIGSLVAGTMYRGEFEGRLKDVLEEAQDERVILFIDEIHTVVGAGGAGGALDMANMLKPALAQSEITVIGATTPEEYKKTIARDPALARRFNTIAVHEETEERTLAILRHTRDVYQKHHQAVISDETLETVVAYARRYLPQRKFPDKALDLLDEAAARARQNAAPLAEEQELAQVERELRETQNEKRMLVYSSQYDMGLKLKEMETALLDKWSRLKTDRSGAKKPVVVRPEHVKETVRDLLGAAIIEDIGPAELDIEKTLSEKIAGQKEAVGKISEAITRAQAGLTSSGRPMASFLFLGPSGVGKTHTAKQLARVVFGADAASQNKFSNFIRLDMSEFSEPHSIARLIGAPPGYVGFEEGGFLTERVRNNPYSLVLFDEIEKAHPQISSILLQMLDEGTLTDAHSEPVDFQNTIIVITSNVGSEEFSKKALGFTEAAFEPIRKNVLRSLKDILRPELLNRLDHVITFLPLDLPALKEIVRSGIDELAGKLKQKKDILLSADDSAVAWLSEKSQKENEGARPAKRILAEFLEFPMAQKMLEGKIKHGAKINVGAGKKSKSLEFKVTAD